MLKQVNIVTWSLSNQKLDFKPIKESVFKLDHPITLQQGHGKAHGTNLRFED